MELESQSRPNLAVQISRRKIVDLLGVDDAKAVFSALDEAAQALGTRAGIARNSATAARTMLDQQIDDLSAQGFWKTVGDLKPVEAGRRIAQMALNNTREAQAAGKTEIVADIAKLLTDYRGPRAKQVLAAVEKLQTGKPITDGQAKAIGLAVTRGAISTGYPALQQAQSR